MPNYESLKNQSNRIKHRRIIIVGLIVVVGILSITNLVLSARLSHVGIAIKDYQNKSNSLMLEINLLEQEINQHASLTRIRAKSDDFGFGTEYQAIVLPKTLPVAYHSN